MYEHVSECGTASSSEDERAISKMNLLQRLSARCRYVSGHTAVTGRTRRRTPRNSKSPRHRSAHCSPSLASWLKLESDGDVVEYHLVNHVDGSECDTSRCHAGDELFTPFLHRTSSQTRVYLAFLQRAAMLAMQALY